MNVEQMQAVKDIIEIAKMVNEAGYTADKDYFAEIVFRDAVRAYFATKYHTSSFDNIKIEL